MQKQAEIGRNRQKWLKWAKMWHNRQKSAKKQNIMTKWA